MEKAAILHCMEQNNSLVNGKEKGYEVKVLLKEGENVGK